MRSSQSNCMATTLWNDWNDALLNVDELPDNRFLENLLRKQLKRSDQFKQTYASYGQDIAQGRGSRVAKDLTTWTHGFHDFKHLQFSLHFEENFGYETNYCSSMVWLRFAEGEK